MTFELSPSESIEEGIRRAVSGEIETALEQCRLDPKAKDGARAVAVHEVRKCLKRIRAALRLVRDELGEPVYRKENARFRDAARPLTEVRDAQVLVGTLDSLALTPPSEPIRDALLGRERAVVRRVLLEGHAFDGVRDALERALARVPTWKIEHDGWEALEGGVRRVYRAGRAALALAEASPTVENLHELRKQAKYMWHLLQLVQSGRPDDGLVEHAHELSRTLGDDHDLAVLRQAVQADPETYGSGRERERLFSVIDHRREELGARSLLGGRKFYAARPRDFAHRVQRHFSALPDPTPSLPRARPRTS